MQHTVLTDQRLSGSQQLTHFYNVDWPCGAVLLCQLDAHLPNCPLWWFRQMMHGLKLLMHGCEKMAPDGGQRLCHVNM